MKKVELLKLLVPILYLKDISRVFPVNEAIIQRKNDVQNLFSKQTTQKIAALFALY